jgi:hypothetical protein
MSNWSISPAVGDVVVFRGEVLITDLNGQSRVKAKVATSGQLDEITVTSRYVSLVGMPTPAAEIISINPSADFQQLQTRVSDGISVKSTYTGAAITLAPLNARGELQSNLNTFWSSLSEFEDYTQFLTSGALDASELGLIAQYKLADELTVTVGTAGVGFTEGDLGGCAGAFSPTTSTNIELDKSVLSATANNDYSPGDRAGLHLRGPALYSLASLGGSLLEGALLYSDGTKFSTVVSGEDKGKIDKLTATMALVRIF